MYRMKTVWTLELHRREKRPEDRRFVCGNERYDEVLVQYVSNEESRPLC